MQTIDKERSEDAELHLNGSNRVEAVRMELREIVLRRRKENRASTWNKSRTNLGGCPGLQQFSIKYVDEKVKLLKRKRISLVDYRCLPNALIQVCFSVE